ncbi:MAG: hypothetical protein A4E73_00743 [Syntrophaceae bacterium PtaU1.Bin231]|nr:MAG: hypothetical protein A4E73_00743 [Syntrophaceae bacterium PtaU1.Bin231]
MRALQFAGYALGMLILAACVAATLSAPQALHAEEPYTFDSSEIEKKPYHFGGYLEARPVNYWSDTDAALYKLKFYNRDEGRTLQEFNLKLQLEGSYEQDMARLYFKTNTNYKNSYLGSDEQSTFYEAYGTLKPSDSFKADAGKRTFKWGKGYAWNPAAFIDRPKDPEDPEVGLEGFIGLSADYVKSFSGPLKTLAVTPVLIPVTGEINKEFGRKDYLNLAGKLYVLLYDTDIDLMFLTGGSKTTRYGADFSRNITTNWEIHGEFAYILDYQRTFIDRSGRIHSDEYNAVSYLAGTRYLTARDTTFIFEFYHNGTGFMDNEVQDYFGYINDGYQTYLTTGNDAALQRAVTLTESTYGRINPMRDYLYLRIVQKEPFDILYFNPAVTTILNLNDGSFSLSPEIVYTRIKNLELRLKASFIVGSTDTEYGEKPNDYRLELRAGYYF